MNHVLSNIKRVRKSKKITMEEIADKLCIDYSTYAKVERGQIELTVSRMEKIAEALGVKVSDIYQVDMGVI